MAGRIARWGLSGLALASVGGCHGGLTLHTLVLVVTVGIFVGTIFLDRSP